MKSIKIVVPVNIVKYIKNMKMYLQNPDCLDPSLTMTFVERDIKYGIPENLDADNDYVRSVSAAIQVLRIDVDIVIVEFKIVDSEAYVLFDILNEGKINVAEVLAIIEPVVVKTLLLYSDIDYVVFAK